MKITPRILTRSLIAGAVAASIPLALYARSDAGEGCQHPAAMQGEHFRGHGDGGEVMHMLRGLNLTDAQRDKIFKLVYADMPAMRDQGKVLRDNHAQLRQLTLSDQYDEGKVKALTEQNAAAMAQMEQMRARTGHEIYQILTPEQHKTLDERRARFADRMHQRNGEWRGHGPDRGPGHGPGPDDMRG